jgi:hypothetical protein
MSEKIHYRKAFNSPYLSSADIVQPTILTVAFVKLELDKTKKTKDWFNTAHFVEKELRQGEPLKPMILNAYNSKIMRDICGSPFIDDWVNTPITVYVDKNVKFGRDTVEGLRINPNRPQLTKPDLLENTPAWVNAKAAYLRDGNFDKVLARMHISDSNLEQLLKEIELERE